MLFLTTDSGPWDAACFSFCGWSVLPLNLLCFQLGFLNHLASGKWTLNFEAGEASKEKVTYRSPAWHGEEMGLLHLDTSSFPLFLRSVLNIGKQSPRREAWHWAEMFCSVIEIWFTSEAASTELKTVSLKSGFSSLPEDYYFIPGSCVYNLYSRICSQEGKRWNCIMCAVGTSCLILKARLKANCIEFSAVASELYCNPFL